MSTPVRIKNTNQMTFGTWQGKKLLINSNGGYWCIKLESIRNCFNNFRTDSLMNVLVNGKNTYLRKHNSNLAALRDIYISVMVCVWKMASSKPALKTPLKLYLVRISPCCRIVWLYVLQVSQTGLLLLKPLIFNRLRRSSVQVGLYIFALTEIALCFGK